MATTAAALALNTTVEIITEIVKTTIPTDPPTTIITTDPTTSTTSTTTTTTTTTTPPPPPIVPSGPAPALNLVVSTKDSEPFVYREFQGNDEVYKGFLVDVLDHVSKKAGFTYNFQQSTGDAYGHLTQNGDWTGIVGDVKNGVAQLGAAAMTMTPEREEAVDFSKPFLTDSVNLLVYKPSYTDLGLGYLVRPFAGEFWIMFLVVLLLVGIVFTIIGKFSPYEWGNVGADKDPRGARNSFSLRNSYLFALSTLTWQGYREAPRSLSGRIAAAFWWMFVLFSLIAYTANLTAYLLSRPEQIPDLPFKTYEDLVDSTEISVGALKFGSTQNALSTSRSQDLVSLWTKMNKQNSWEESYRDGAKRVEAAEGKYVFMMEASSAEFFARRNCKLMIYGDNLFPTSMGFALPKGSIWKDKINNALTDLREDGVLEQLHDKYWRFNGDCKNVDGRTMLKNAGFMSTLPVYPITLKDMAVAILLLFIGGIASILFLIVEIVHYNVTKKGKKLHRPAIVKNPPKLKAPKIFKGKSKGAEKPAAVPADIEAGGEEEPVASSSGDGLDSVPLDDTAAVENEGGDNGAVPDAAVEEEGVAESPAGGDETDELLSDKEKAEA